MTENKKNRKSKNKDENENFDEFQIIESNQTKFDLIEYFSKDECTAYYFGQVPIDQKGYVCSVCDSKMKDLICRFCHKSCHRKCRETLIQDPEEVEKKEKFGLQKFACHCGVALKHTFDLKKTNTKIHCSMMQLDQELEIPPYHCITHDIIICCICAVVCHKECTIVSELEVIVGQNCNCISDFHSHFNEMALSFPLEQYKKISHMDIWPIQILNILFSTGTIFNQMKHFFKKFLSNDISFQTRSKAVVKKFADILELFSNTFNSKFKSYYYHEELSNLFPYQTLFTFIKNLEVRDAPTCIIKFRLLFILLFIHLRKDFQVFKALTSNDFLCNNALQRITIRKMYRSKNIFTENINIKYKILKGDPLKVFALKELCNLITNGMKYISVEENQDEFEISLKIICFMLKRLMFNKEDLVLLINSLYNFYENFYEYMMSSKNNIYSLVDIFYGIVEICYMISVYYNDLIIEECLESGSDISSKKFIITKSSHSNKLLVIIFKNCDIFSKHYDLLIKPEADTKSKEERKREEKLRKHLLIMQQNILSKTTGVSNNMPENGGMFKDKIISLFNETLALYYLTDNLYQKQLENITTEDLKEFYKFCDKIEDSSFYKIMKLSNGKEHSNILLNLKIVLEELYFDLFTTSYKQQHNHYEKKLRTRILNAFDEINNNIESFSKTSPYSKLIKKFENKENELKKNKEKEDDYLDEDEKIKRKILKDISVNINFAKSPFLLIEEGRELIVDNLIVSQIDETLFKGLRFLTNIHFPNIISHELVRLYFHFLGLFLLTKRGIRYVLMGKNLKNIQRLINRFRFDPKNKNLVETKGRTTFFNVNSIKVVIHYFCLLSNFIRIYNIQSINQHKALPKFQKSILIHLKYYSSNVDNEDAQIEFKQQLKECLEIFNNLHRFYTYNEFEIIKFDLIENFKKCSLKLLNPELFQKWFDKTSLDFDDPTFKKRRKWDLAFYFQFFKLISKETFYVYDNDVKGKKLIEWLKSFIDIETLSFILNTSNELFSCEYKTTLFHFIRTYYLVDELNQVNYLKKNNLLTTDQYKSMIENDLIKDTKVTQYIVEKKDIKKRKKKNKKKKKNGEKDLKENQIKKEKMDSTKVKLYYKKLNYINELILLLTLYTNEIEKFPENIYNEKNITIKEYIKEIILAIHDISTILYYNKNIINKIFPHYYKLIVNFFKKKPIFLKMLDDIEENKKVIAPKDYIDFMKEENLDDDYEFFINKAFSVFDKDYMFKIVIKTIFEIYKKTHINEEYSLEKFLKIYDIFNEVNFPPFSLLEVKDYEYFYEENDEEENEDENSSDKDFKKLNSIKESFIAQYKDIASSAFLGIISGESTNKKIDYGTKYVNLFRSFINSKESSNLANYRTLLCIMVKLLLYDGEHIQELFKELCYNKYFFKNLNRELNYHIVQCVNSAKKYELFFGCIKITDITKLTIQFLQLLGEGFNIEFHDNILKGIIKIKKTNKKIEEGDEENKENKDKEEFENESDDDSLKIEINEETVEKAINLTVKNELNKKREVPLVETKMTIYQSMIYNLRIIYHLMSLSLPVEGELAYDKLCILTSNIIDFIIEYIDTKKELNYIIDNNIKSLMFGKDKEDEKINNDYSNINKKGVFSIFKLKINNKDESIEESNKYKLRKTMIGYMKIKYFQLLKAYLQIGNKNDFVHLMLKKNLGPFDLFGEIIYYMKELINNLIFKDYDKYNNLLIVEDTQTYISKLNELYKYDEDFRTSIEMNIIQQICIIIATLEEMYKITMLKTYFKKEKKKEYDNLNEEKQKNEVKEEKKEEQKEEETEKVNFPSKRDENYYHPKSEENLLDNYDAITNDQNTHVFDYSPNKAVFRKINETPYKSLKENYNKRKEIRLKEENEKKEMLLKKRIIKLDEEFLKLDSKFVKAVYYFLSSLVSKVEVRMVNDNEEKKVDTKAENNYKFISNKISRELLKIKNKSSTLSNIVKSRKLSVNLISNENIIDDNSELSGEDDEIQKRDNITTFFIKPHLTFHLSEHTKNYFINNVDRAYVYSKYSSLISFSDYCIFEMMYNMRYINKSNIKKRLSEIDLYYIQIINFLLIAVENTLLMFHYYKSSISSQEEYDVIDPDLLNTRFPDVLITIFIKFGVNGFAFFIWFYCQFIIVYQRNIILKGLGNFIFRKSDEISQNINHPIMINFFQNNGSLFETMDLINRNVDIFTKIKIVLIDTILGNLEINMFIFSIIFDLLFIFFGSPIFLSIETIFIVGIFPFLINIFKAFGSKFSTIITCLLFTYCIIYIYNWIAIFYLQKTFDFGEVFEYDSSRNIEEPFCHSSVQCLFVLINYGTRSGGGIGDQLPTLSFKNDYNNYIARFFYDMTFYIFVIMIMGNITFGLIVDSFGSLRDETYNYENDKENKCFICQISRDRCLLKSIDFDSHVNYTHNIWNYVDFLCYLHLYDPNNFTRVEGFVWDKLSEKDFGWIPKDNDEEEDEEGE